jgi:hypothetical protein
MCSRPDHHLGATASPQQADVAALVQAGALLINHIAPGSRTSHRPHRA